MGLEAVLSNVSPWAVVISVSLVVLGLLLTAFHGSLSGPGPWGVPIFGFYPFLKKDLHLQLHELAKKYGPVYKLNVCGQTFVYMESMKAIRESHITKSDDFPHRNDKSSLFYDAFEEGLVIVKGEQWKTLRKFLNQSLRDVGISSNKEVIGPFEDAIKAILDVFSKSQGKPVDLLPLFATETTRAVARLFLGQDVKEEDLWKINEGYFELFMPFVDSNLLLAGTFAKYFIVPFTKAFATTTKGANCMRDALNRVLNQRKASFDPNQQPDNVIDAYLKEKAIREKKGDPTAKYFTDKSLVSTLIQAYGDASNGLGFFISSYIFELSKRRDVQDAIYEEIVAVVGTERLPTMDDRSKLPYTNSAMKELLRVSNLFPLFPGLECTRDTTVQGVNVPKGSIALLNYWAAHRDPEVYQHPDEFDATRFLPDKPKVEPPITFGVGKRSCAGERLVMTAYFLLLTSIFQNFSATVEVEDGNGPSLISAEAKTLVRLTPRKK